MAQGCGRRWWQQHGMSGAHGLAWAQGRAGGIWPAGWIGGTWAGWWNLGPLARGGVLADGVFRVCG
jgi:hypothetical protein